MSFRPRNYQDALEYLNARRRRKERDYRVISTHQEPVMQSNGRMSAKGQPVETRDQLVANTDNPTSTYGPNPPAISFRQWNTNIATFYPDGSVAITPWDSNSTRERMNDMGLPATVSTNAVGLTKNQCARLCDSNGLRVEMKGFRYGLPADRAYLLDADKNLHPNKGEPEERIYVEAEPGVHQRYQLGRKRVLKVLKQYADMVGAMVGADLPYFTSDALKRHIVETALACPSLGRLREVWLPDIVRTYGETVALGTYIDARDKLGLYNLTHRTELWVPKTVKSRELDQWI